MQNIEQEVNIPAKPETIYDALMDEKIHSDFTGASATIENKIAGNFEVWDGYASGMNIELIPGKKIVQTWRASDWPENAISEISIDLSPDGEETRLNFRQKNIPDEFADDVEQGWYDFYWQPLIKYFKEIKK